MTNTNLTNTDLVTADTVTGEQLVALHDESIAAGDLLTAVIAERALGLRTGHDNFADLTADQQEIVLSLTTGQSLERCAAAIKDRSRSGRQLGGQVTALTADTITAVMLRDLNDDARDEGNAKLAELTRAALRHASLVSMSDARALCAEAVNRSSAQRASDVRAIRSLAEQDLAGDTDDSFARTGDPEDTIRRWYLSARKAGDDQLVEIVDRIGIDAAAQLYLEARS